MEVNHSAPYAIVAVAFARALVDGRFSDAHSMLSSGFRAAVDPDRIRNNYDEMIEYGEGPPTVVKLMSTMEQWPDKQSHDLGWAYVSISGDDFSEAVTVVLEQEAGKPVIRQLEWGRP
ncbi:MAG: hypothetical protein R3F08_13585 [Dokdonella sp.]|nr:hypothetical protein [Dokdonella sp.]MCB1571751.1 hypothetical protein [Xanthomonadales bacterium]